MVVRSKQTIRFLLLSMMVITLMVKPLYSQYADTSITMYTPEGKPLTAWKMQEASSGQIQTWNDWTEYWIDYYKLYAVQIGSSSRRYNCHGYAWSLSEGGSAVWIGYSASEGDPEKTYWTDENYANDILPSYLTESHGVTESEATHAWYNLPGDDHSVRRIVNSYPETVRWEWFYYDGPVYVKLDYVSKWNRYGLVQHAKGHDIYRKGATHGFDFFKLKTTHYGTLSNYPKTWIGAGGITHTVTANIICPNTLTVKSGASVNLNGKYIKCSGSGKIINNGSVAPNITAKKYLTQEIKGLYSTIQQAVNNANNAYEYIYVGAGTYNGNIYMKTYSDVLGVHESDVTINGDIYFNNTSVAHLRSVTVNGRIYGDHDLSSWIAFVYPKERLEFYHSDCDVQFVSSWNNPYDPWGLSAESYSDITIDYSVFRDKSYALVAEWYADLDVNHTGLCQNDVDVLGEGPGGWVDLDFCSFSSPAEGSTIENEGYTITWNDWKYCGLSKSVASAPRTIPDDIHVDASLEIEDGKSDSAKDKYERAVEKYRALKQKISGKRLAGEKSHPRDFTGDYLHIIELFGHVTDTYPETPYSIKSLEKITKCLRSIGRQGEAFSLINTKLKDKKYGSMEQQMKSLLIPIYIDNKEYDKALVLSDELLAELPNGKHACRILYGKGLIYKFYLKDDQNAREVFEQLMKDYPSDHLALLAEDHLGGKGSAPRIQPGGQTTEKETVAGLSLANFPNPFNTTTTIQYGLPEDGHVTLRIYSLQGRLVATLINEEKQTGLYSVEWNNQSQQAIPVSSGLYFYKMIYRSKEGDSKVLTGKMMYLK